MVFYQMAKLSLSSSINLLIHEAIKSFAQKSSFSRLRPPVSGPGNCDRLEWSARQIIAVGAARGLRCLHGECRVGCSVYRDILVGSRPESNRYKSIPKGQKCLTIWAAIKSKRLLACCNVFQSVSSETRFKTSHVQGSSDVGRIMRNINSARCDSREGLARIC
ncbi:hypothetical protein ACFE04_011579 [Oxalis oulophora]